MERGSDEVTVMKKTLLLLPLALTLAATEAWAEPGAAVPAERSFEVWHGSRPIAWTLLTSLPESESASLQAAPPKSEVAGSKPVLWSLRGPAPEAAPATAPVETKESLPVLSLGTKPAVDALSMNGF